MSLSNQMPRPSPSRPVPPKSPVPKSLPPGTKEEISQAVSRTAGSGVQPTHYWSQAGIRQTPQGEPQANPRLDPQRDPRFGPKEHRSAPRQSSLPSFSYHLTRAWCPSRLTQPPPVFGNLRGGHIGVFLNMLGRRLEAWVNNPSLLLRAQSRSGESPGSVLFRAFFICMVQNLIRQVLSPAISPWLREGKQGPLRLFPPLS